MKGADIMFCKYCNEIAKYCTDEDVLLCDAHYDDEDPEVLAYRLKPPVPVAPRPREEEPDIAF
jgi:hypothetical protein